MPEFPPDKREPQGNDPESPSTGRRLRASSRPRFRGESAASAAEHGAAAEPGRGRSAKPADRVDSPPQRAQPSPPSSADRPSRPSVQDSAAAVPSDSGPSRSSRREESPHQSPHDEAKAPTPRPVAPRTRREARMLRAAAARGAGAAEVAAAAERADSPTPAPAATSATAAPTASASANAGAPASPASPGDRRRHAPRAATTHAASRTSTAGSAEPAGERRSAQQSADGTRAASHGPSRARRHSSRLGETFPSLVGWTSLSALLPGVGLLRTRFRPFGLIVLGGFVLTLLIALGYLLIEGPVRAIAKIVANPTLLNILAVAAIIVGIVWIIAVVLSHIGLRRGNRYARWQNRLSAVLVLSLALIIGIPFGIGSVYARVQSDTVASLFGASTGRAVDAQELWKDRPFINVFLIGRDNGDDREGTRPDTMLVASIDTRSGNTALISVPRNLAFPIFPEGSSLAQAWPNGFRPTGDSSVDLINAVWQWGEQNPNAVGDTSGLEPGMTATMSAVEGSLGLSLDYWASVDMAGFEDLVNAIGGVQIDVERPIPMGGGTSLSGVPNRIFGWIDPGPQTLTGQTALWYVRSREGSDNYDRMCRQQRMLKTTLEQIDPQELAAAYPKLAGSATENIATSIPQNEIPAFIELALAVQKANVTTVQINNSVTPTYNPDFSVLRSWIQNEIQSASASQSSPAPTTGSSGGDSSESTPGADSAQDTEIGAEAPAGSGTDTATTDDSTLGEPNAEGKCYPQDYSPGDPFPGYPGPGAGEQG